MIVQAGIADVMIPQHDASKRIVYRVEVGKRLAQSFYTSFPQDYFSGDVLFLVGEHSE